ncbi:IS5 family transposase [Burkholderia sp. DN3021]|uniref:IS5 family transposase n=1 Tax=Burkholderia sp. DN3021 TaxID=3410137 RepID=UPI003C7A75BB
MPYKASLKAGAPRKRPNPTYRVANARAYNQSLKRRGQLSLYCPHGDLKALFINTQPYVPGVSGRAPTYTNAYIELIYTFYRLFRWAMRQITGFMEEYWRLRGLEIAVPSFGQLSERFATLTVPVRQRCQRVANRLAQGEAISLIVDSTGMNFGRASEWHRQKYGRDASRTPWRKVHLSIDPDMNMPAIAVTETTVSDAAGLPAVLAVDAPVDCVIADGAYYSIAQTEAWSSSGVLPVIPPPANAVVHAQPATRWHDQIVGYIKEKGIHAFHNKYGYGKRALVEAQISRIKRCIGARLLTRRLNRSSARA